MMVQPLTAIRAAELEARLAAAHKPVGIRAADRRTVTAALLVVAVMVEIQATRALLVTVALPEAAVLEAVR